MAWSCKNLCHTLAGNSLCLSCALMTCKALPLWSQCIAASLWQLYGGGGILVPFASNCFGKLTWKTLWIRMFWERSSFVCNFSNLFKHLERTNPKWKQLARSRMLKLNVPGREKELLTNLNHSLWLSFLVSIQLLPSLSPGHILSPCEEHPMLLVLYSRLRHTSAQHLWATPNS